MTVRGMPETPDYGYRSSAKPMSLEYLLPVLKAELARRAPAPLRVLDLGCGNGATAGALQSLGYAVLGIDSSESGIEVAWRAHPGCRFVRGSVYDDLAAEHGRFPLVVSLEVIEHLYSPRGYCETFWNLLEPGGVGIVSTPFHGYWKNLTLALSNGFDAHFSPEWEGGHVKFWSERTIGALLRNHGFTDLEFERAGRIRPLAKSTVVSFRRPGLQSGESQTGSDRTTPRGTP